ncbi:MAG: class I poly(R)-hydroxyalkanoic acid synthase [Alphaproteobacteria bacterium]
MADDNATQQTIPDPVAIAQTVAKIAERSQKIVVDFMQRQNGQSGGQFGMSDPLNVAGAFVEMTTQMMANPAKLVKAQIDLWQTYVDLWTNSAKRMMGHETEPLIMPERGDRRFKHSDWDDNALFDFVKQSYLLTARWMQSTVRSVDGLDDKTAKKVDFYTRQFVDAMAPSNFVVTNPEVLRTTVESGGDNLLKGLDNLLRDLERGKGQLHIKMTESDVFKLGENIAVTPGKVVYPNDFLQLLQYQPTTEKVFKKPLLIIPPWINKYYILDLQPKNSFIKWAVDQGHTVFVVSWVNPDREMAQQSFEHYMLDGPLAALGAIEKATGEKSVNVIGYCLGGTLLACALAYMKAKGDKRVASATFFTTMIDFSEPGELGVFIDEEQLATLEERMAQRGFLEGHEMATTFNMLRANDLIWTFVVNNYLMGKDPFPFDLLHWNSDSTRMPAAMHSFYLRNMYQENRLVVPGGITLDGVPIDLSTVDTPSFFLSTREDHIAPWTSTFAATNLFAGPVRFCLAASGHIAGVINPPGANKYSYWTASRAAKTAETWLRNAAETPGSWWPEWQKWIEKQAGPLVAARKPGDGKLKPIEDAPGSYVRVLAQD